jgi:hypothetical protein
MTTNLGGNCICSCFERCIPTGHHHHHHGPLDRSCRLSSNVSSNLAYDVPITLDGRVKSSATLSIVKTRDNSRHLSKPRCCWLNARSTTASCRAPKMAGPSSRPRPRPTLSHVTKKERKQRAASRRQPAIKVSSRHNACPYLCALYQFTPTSSNAANRFACDK